MIILFGSSVHSQVIDCFTPSALVPGNYFDTFKIIGGADQNGPSFNIQTENLFTKVSITSPDDFMKIPNTKYHHMFHGYKLTKCTHVKSGIISHFADLDEDIKEMVRVLKGYANRAQTSGARSLYMSCELEKIDSSDSTKFETLTTTFNTRVEVKMSEILTFDTRVRPEDVQSKSRFEVVREKFKTWLYHSSLRYNPPNMADMPRLDWQHEVKDVTEDKPRPLIYPVVTVNQQIQIPIFGDAPVLNISNPWRMSELTKYKVRWTLFGEEISYIKERSFAGLNPTMTADEINQIEPVINIKPIVDSYRAIQALQASDGAQLMQVFQPIDLPTIDDIRGTPNRFYRKVPVEFPMLVEIILPEFSNLSDQVNLYTNIMSCNRFDSFSN